jgi:hypothetical protein
MDSREKREYLKKYYREHVEYYKEYNKRYYEEHKKESAERVRKYRRNHPELKESHRIGANEYHKNMKNKFFEIYGNKCNYCGETDRTALCLDHVKDDMAYRKKTGSTGWKEYRKAIETYDPNNYQILCFNCNMLKQKNKIKTTSSKNSKYRERLKNKFFDMYGGKCANPKCGIMTREFLTLDHVNNDGSKRRGNDGYNEYRTAVEELDFNTYQILCANCNFGRKRKLGFIGEYKSSDG